MIFVTNAPIENAHKALTTQERKHKQLQWLLNHPNLLYANKEFRNSPLMQFNNASNLVCVLQKEFATASSQLVQFIGTAEATTCVALGIRNPRSGLTSVAHFDFEGCVKEGVSQMLNSLSPEEDTLLEVHFVGAYNDTMGTEEAHSLPLCLALVEALRSVPYKMDIRTFCVLDENTVEGKRGYHYPIVRGLAIDTSSGRCVPACFSENARGPDAIVRGLSMSFAAPKSRLNNFYDTFSDSFTIPAFKWSRQWKDYAAYSLSMSDEELLQSRSTSPYAETPDFINSIRRSDEYLYNHPKWEETFPNKQARSFVRNASGLWTQRYGQSRACHSKYGNHNICGDVIGIEQ